MVFMSSIDNSTFLQKSNHCEANIVNDRMVRSMNMIMKLNHCEAEPKEKEKTMNMTRGSPAVAHLKLGFSSNTSSDA